MKYILTFIAACAAIVTVGEAKSYSTKCPDSSSNPFTPQNYPGIIFNEVGKNALCYNGYIIFLVETSAQCLADAGCYTLENDRSKIEELLAEIKKNPQLGKCRR
ncbi:hypothetical protein K493DRAFT_305824 [Basidiobolus meristosporus CBS 931.73]|uniref:Uncharacterized protein n=1 Tax=Basidiobolus meristosporus CBS 931.73 TaxID=1314790 RepID=A0A1Y1XUE2_9FUNG|nr:hypothetical protein K493DRAFT_305824 [Basidiobolus meristosporus CBS 931.73]|eukprot:ORX89368.1 hypothetical protein K493DRAFT_305824 [Basidiobolus meristosporus CBS 931.73]